MAASLSGVCREGVLSSRYQCFLCDVMVDMVIADTGDVMEWLPAPKVM